MARMPGVGRAANWSEAMTTNPVTRGVTFHVGAPPKARRRSIRPHGLLEWLGLVQAIALVVIYVVYILPRP